MLFPPSIIGSAVVLGAAGAGIGGLQKRHHRKELAEELTDAIDPGHSGLVLLVSDPAAVELQQALAKADHIVQKAVDKAAAEEIKAEANVAPGDGGRLGQELTSRRRRGDRGAPRPARRHAADDANVA